MPSGKGPAKAKSIRIDPAIRRAAKDRAKSLGISFSLYTALLLRPVISGLNQIVPRNRRARLMREPVSITMPDTIWHDANRLTKIHKIPLPQILEAIYEKDCLTGGPLAIHPITVQ